MAAGRCIDADNAALSSVRVMGPCIAMGAAAAKALDLAGTGSVHQIDIAALAERVHDNVEAQTYEVARPGGTEVAAEEPAVGDPNEADRPRKSDVRRPHGRAKARAMDLLVRYGEALGAERLVETNNVAGAFNASTPSVRELAKKGFDAVYSELNLDSAEVVEVPKMAANTCQLITGIDNANWRDAGHPGGSRRAAEAGRSNTSARRGINMFATCTPYQVGNVPVKGEHCAWMESSAVVYCNSVLGARTNTEGKESTGAAALTGRIPYWGYHIAETAAAPISSKSTSTSTTSWIGVCSATISARSSRTKFRCSPASCRSRA